MKRLFWERIYAGFYEAKAEVTLRTNIATRRVEATFQVRYIPEWTGSERWALTVDSEFGTLTKLTDSIWRTARDAKASAEVTARDGYESCGMGWAAYVPGTKTIIR